MADTPTSKFQELVVAQRRRKAAFGAVESARQAMDRARKELDDAQANLDAITIRLRDMADELAT